MTRLGYLIEQINYNKLQQDFQQGGDGMEFILALLIIIVICKIFGVSNEMLVFAGLVLIELTIIGMY